MEDKDVPQRAPLIVCPECGGEGESGSQTCPQCGGYGMGGFYADRFLYWGAKFTRSGVVLRRGKRSTEKAIDVAVYVVALFGVACLVWWIWRNSSLEAKELLFFWRTKHWLILSFWISVLAWMFIVYRKWKELLDKQKISVLRPLRNISPPDNWEELIKYEHTINVYDTCSEEGVLTLENAFLLAEKFGHREVRPVHLLLSLLRNKTIRAIFVRLNVDGKELKDKLKKQLEQQPRKESRKRTSFSAEIKEALVESFINAYEYEQKATEPLNMIAPTVEKEGILKEILLDLKADPDKINNIVEWFKIDEELRNQQKQYRKAARFKPGTNMDRAYTAIATPILDRFGYDLTLAAKRGRVDLCVAREQEKEAIFETLNAGNNGILLTGPEGIGKRTIIEGLARLMVKEQVPRSMRDKRLVEVDVARLISGADPAQAEKRLLAALDEVLAARNILLYIKNIENIVGISPGGEGSMELSEVLADALARYNIYCFATATGRNYVKYIEETALGNQMNRVKIKEPTGDQAIRIVESKIGRLESKFKVFYTYNAIEEAINLSSKYIHTKHQPTKAIQVLEKAGASLVGSGRSKKKPLCGKEMIRTVIQEMTDIPADKVTEQEGSRLLNLEEEIHKHLINQNEAVEAVSDSLRRARAELRQDTRTIANFLFLGPTGVGKTELAKTVAKVYFGGEDYMIRMDMSEYQHEDSVRKMIGDGEVKGRLTEMVRHKPYALILLDEFEKAHPKILTLFLQVMDDGRLTDGEGRTVDFTNTMIVATSNAASSFIQKQIREERDVEDIKRIVVEEKLPRSLPPELINRFDGVIVFKPLSERHILEVTKLILEDTREMLQKKGIKLRINNKGAEKLAREGFDPKFGARPIRRVVEKRINNEIAKKLLSGELGRRDTAVITEAGKVMVEKAEEL